jgi:hypothetical protein
MRDGSKVKMQSINVTDAHMVKTLKLSLMNVPDTHIYELATYTHNGLV